MRRSWWVDLGWVATFAAVTAVLTTGWVDGLDYAVRDWCDTHRPEASRLLARVLNVLGNGTPLTVIALVLAGACVVRQRSPRALLVPVVAFALTTAVILPLKGWTDRAAPRSPVPDPAALFNTLPPGMYGESYPAGHVIVAIVWYGVIVWLLGNLIGLPRRFVVAVRVAPVAIVFVTVTYLSFHWLTDSIAAIPLGLALDRIVSRLATTPGVTPSSTSLPARQ